MKTTTQQNYIDSKSNNFVFSTMSSQKIKGVALILMLIHHIFSFPDWWTVQDPYIGILFKSHILEDALGDFGKITVAIFAFLTGYGMFYMFQKNNSIKKCIKKGFYCLINYWIIIFFVFLPVNLILGNNYLLDIRLILKNMVVASQSIIGFSWYIRFYILILFSLPFLIKACKVIKNPYICIFSIWAVSALVTKVIGNLENENLNFLSEYFTYMPCVITGICFAQYKLFDLMNIIVAKHKLNTVFITCLVIIVRLAVAKTRLIPILIMDTFLSPIFIYCIVDILHNLNSKVLDRLLFFIGKHSLNLWLLHAIFFFNTRSIQWVLYLPKYSVAIIIWCILILLPISMLVNFILLKIKALVSISFKTLNSQKLHWTQTS